MAVAVAGYSAAAAERLGVLVLGVGVGAAVFLALSLARAVTASVPLALVGLMAAWTASAWSSGGEVPRATALVAAGIFVVAEFADWSLEQAVVPDEPELVARRAGGLAIRAAGALALAAVIVAALGLRAGSGLLLEAVGVAAAVALLALVVALARGEPAGR